MAAHDSYAALRFRDYRLLLGGAVLTSIGGQMQTYAVGWELYHRTHSANALAYAGLFQFLPVLLLALPAGHAADRYSRKGLFQLAQVAAGLASLGLTALSTWQGPVDLVYLCLVLAAVGRAFSAPARSSLLAQIVPVDVLHNAVTWNSSGWQVANVGGPALGGLIVALTGRAAPVYFLAASCALGCAALVAPVRPRAVSWPGSSSSGTTRRSWPPSPSTCLRSCWAVRRRCCRFTRRTSCTSIRSASAFCGRRRPRAPA